MNVRKISGLGVVLVAMMGCSEEEAVPRAESDVGGETSSDAIVPNDTGTSDAVVEDTAADSAEVSLDAGTPADCIDGTAMDPFFTLEDTTKCLVAKYEVPVGSLGNLSWGRHGGPLGLEGGTTPNLVRYELPASASGTLTIKKTPVAVTGVPSSAFFGPAVDLPFFGWTAFTYTGSGTGFPGEILLVNASGALTRYHVNGFYSGAGVGLSSTSAGRLLYSGLGAISATASSSNAGGIYAADSCGSAAAPRLLPEGDASCKAPLKIATWEAGSSGPLTVDPEENVFAILSTFGGKQELRAFERSTVARGGGETAGETMFSDTEYTSDLVADGHAVYWQPNDASSFSPVDPKMLAYKVDSATKKVTPDGTAKTFLKMKNAGKSVTLVRDSSRRIWVGVSVPGTGDAGPTSSMFFVLRAKTP